METRGRFGLWRVAATIVPLLAVAFGSFLVGGTSVADAATSGSFSLGCSISKSGGVTNVTMKFNIKLKATNGDMITSSSFDVVGLGGTPDGSSGAVPSGHTYQVTIPVPTPAGPFPVETSYPVELKVNTVVVSTGTAVVKFTATGASCKLNYS